MQKPRLDHIDGLSPAIAIEQKNLGNTPRSTVGTVTEIYDYLRILLARLGTPYCPDCDLPVGTQTVDEIVAKVMDVPEGTRLYLLAPVEVSVGQDYESLWKDVQAKGYVRVRVDGEIHNVDQAPRIDRRRKHQVEIVIDRVVVRKSNRARIAEVGRERTGGRQGSVAGRPRGRPGGGIGVGDGATQPAPGLRPVWTEFRAR